MDSLKVTKGMLILELVVAMSVILTVTVVGSVGGRILYQSAILSFEQSVHLSVLNLARIAAISTQRDIPVNVTSRGLSIHVGGLGYHSSCESNTLAFSRPGLTIHPSGSPSYSGQLTWVSNRKVQRLSVGVGLTPFLL